MLRAIESPAHTYSKPLSASRPYALFWSKLIDVATSVPAATGTG